MQVKKESKVTRESPRQILKRHWGYDSFLPNQEEIIGSVLDGHDTLAIMATGGGKSLCYQLPALCRNGLTIVVSPLISLMKDQVDSLNARGIAAAALSGLPDSRERENIGQALRDGTIRILFLSPEKCAQARFLESLKGMPVSLFAVDEAHCISEWGHNFRPEYRQLSQIKKIFPEVPVIALTASAIPEVRDDICRQLGLASPGRYVGTFNRGNLHYRVIQKKNPVAVLTSYISRHRNEAGIVYCLSKRETEETALGLSKRGFPALAYHAGLPTHERARIQDAFLSGKVKTICATVAFGMGIDKPDVRYVIHYVLPKSLESYYQETGRAGRDGKESECILLYSREDVMRVRSVIESDNAAESHIRLSLAKLRTMVAFCETAGCRRRFILDYFGEPPSGVGCGTCDTCGHLMETSGRLPESVKVITCTRRQALRRSRSPKTPGFGSPDRGH